jgi:hypothetical protein
MGEYLTCFACGQRRPEGLNESSHGELCYVSHIHNISRRAATADKYHHMNKDGWPRQWCEAP